MSFKLFFDVSLTCFSQNQGGFAELLQVSRSRCYLRPASFVSLTLALNPHNPCVQMHIHDSALCSTAHEM